MGGEPPDGSAAPHLQQTRESSQQCAAQQSPNLVTPHWAPTAAKHSHDQVRAHRTDIPRGLTVRCPIYNVDIVGTNTIIHSCLMTGAP